MNITFNPVISYIEENGHSPFLETLYLGGAVIGMAAIAYQAMTRLKNYLNNTTGATIDAPSRSISAVPQDQTPPASQIAVVSKQALSLQPLQQDLVRMPIQVGDVSAKRKTNFLKRIKDAEWKSLVDRMERDGRIATPEEIEAFQKGLWNHPIFLDRNWILSAFHAYLQDQLNEDTMCKLFLFEACRKETEIDSESYGRWNPYFKTFQLYDHTGSGNKINERSKEELRIATADYLTDEQFENLCLTLRDLPVEHTQFFSALRPIDDLIFTIDSMTTGKDRWNLCTPRPKTPPEFQFKKMYQVIAPPELMYQIHRAKAKENVMRPAPILGFAHIEKLSDPNERVVAIPSFFIQPNIIHTFTEVSPLSLYHHDIVYHHAIENANTHRDLWVEFALYLKQERARPGSQISLLDPEIFSVIMEYVLDREFLDYPIQPKEGPANFWTSLLKCFNKVHNALIRKKINLTENKWEEIENALFDNFNAFYHDQKIQPLITKYTLSINSLKELKVTEGLKKLQDLLLSRIMD